MTKILTLAGRGGDGGGSRAQAIALTPGHHRRGGERRGPPHGGPAAPRPSAWPPGHHARAHRGCSALASTRHCRSRAAVPSSIQPEAGGARGRAASRSVAGFGQGRRREIRDSRAAAAKESSAEREPDSNPGGERRGVRRRTSWRRAVADFTRATDGGAWDDSPEAIPVRTQKP